MSQVKNLGAWIAEQVYIHNFTNEKILQDAKLIYGDISESLILGEIEKVRNNPKLYKKLHHLKN